MQVFKEQSRGCIASIGYQIVNDDVGCVNEPDDGCESPIVDIAEARVANCQISNVKLHELLALGREYRVKT